MSIYAVAGFQRMHQANSLSEGFEVANAPALPEATYYLLFRSYTISHHGSVIGENAMSLFIPSLTKASPSPSPKTSQLIDKPFFPGQSSYHRASAASQLIFPMAGFRKGGPVCLGSGLDFTYP